MMNGTMNRTVVWGLTASLMAMTVVAGCLSRTTGNEGNLTFSFAADDNLLDFNKPIGVGARLELTVRESGNNRGVTLLDAKFDDESLGVISFDGNKIIVEGLAEGNAELQVDAELRDGTVVSDSVNLLARVPEVLKLNHTCSDDREALYLTGQRILVPFDMERSNGQPVIGFGLYPVSFDPADALTLDESIAAQQFMHLDTSETAQTVTLKSDIDDTSLTLKLTDPADIDGAELIADFRALVDVPAIYYALPTVGGQRVCQALTDPTVTSDTPEVCEVTRPEDNTDPAAPDNELGFIRVLGKQVGVCSFTVTYPESGASTQLSVDIIDIEEPGDDNAEQEDEGADGAEEDNGEESEESQQG